MAESTTPTQANPTDVGADSNRISWAFLAQYYSFLVELTHITLPTGSTSARSQLAPTHTYAPPPPPTFSHLDSSQNKDPSRLHCFYTKRSTLIHSTEGEETTACYGQQVRSTFVQQAMFKLTELLLGLLIKQEIHHKLMSLKFEDCKVYISNVDSQSSAEGGIIVQVIGEQSNHGGPWRKFSQTFFLAEQPNGYFVLNDICRYIKEEGDDDDINAGYTHPASIVTAAAVSNAHLAGSSLPPAQSTETTAVSDDAAAIAEATPLFADDTYSSIQETFPTLDASPAFNGTQEPQSTTKAEAVKEISSPAAAAPTPLPNGHHAPQATTSTPAEPAEPAVAETETETVVEAKHEEPEASISASTTEELTPAAASAPAVTEEIPSTIAQAATPEPTAAAAAAAPATSTPAPAPAPAPSSSPASTPAPAAEQAPAAPALPAAPAAPKSWASLAAANGGANKWGKTAVASAKGISAAPTPAPSTSTERPSAASTSHEAGSAAGHEGGKTRGKGVSGSSSNAGHGLSASGSTTGAGGNFHDSVLAVTTTMCYIKGVQENVSEKALMDVLTSRFGPMCECSIIRNKACAFVEYESLLSARKALQASVLRSEGGEGGVRVPVDPSHPASNGKDFAIIQILERKEHGERPPSQPRRGPGGGRTGGQGQGQGQPGQGQGQGQQGGNKRTGGGGRTGAQGAQQGNQQGTNNSRGSKPTAATK
ncbi:BZ3500_MvSof-1268-A1-R1_Chr6-2g08470 [Microbotryum saponariae]|uniref:BZ3500_MvSof-1268-A1-R1_Chr6-2g08470 protein n=1 Tax=Microbotryum saponariae TaxID=289078 RepID=A0A2X0NPL6_9BASI|nr:BZ3500_MvSof-1268-A1-R1_Chr6-2g08470 [Microbotryum saponariae]SDA07747.1 BZ3501_MvSof-1269-A2-R1_Chr6-1g08184 [Microbotryum saponariae]